MRISAPSPFSFYPLSIPFKPSLSLLLHPPTPRLEHADAEPTKSPHISRYGRDGRSDRLRETEETARRLEAEIKEDIRGLLRALSNRDQVLTASRRAYQKLDKECKKSVGNTLKKLIIREKEAASARMNALLKLEAAVEEIDIDSDISDFIQHHKTDRQGTSADSALILSSTALSILGDLSTASDGFDAGAGAGAGAVAGAGASGTAGAGGNGNENGNGFGNGQASQDEGLAANINGSSSSSSSSSSGGGAINNINNINNINSSSSSSSSSSVLHTPHPTRDHSASSFLERATGLLGRATSPPPPTPVPASVVSSFSGMGADRQQHSDSSRSNGGGGSGSSSVAATPKHDAKHPAAQLAKKQHSFTNNGDATEVTMHLSRIFYGAEEASRLSGVFSGFEMSRLLEESAAMGSTMAVELAATRMAGASSELGGAVAAGTLGGFARIEALGNASSQTILQHAYSHVLAVGAERARGTPEESITWLARFLKTQNGRDVFVTVLNQFRSRKVDVGSGFTSLGAVLWEALDSCTGSNDVHTAKVIMMLSQTFYHTLVDADSDTRAFRGALFGDAKDPKEKPLFSPDDDDDSGGRDTALRQYLKDRLVDHPLWHDGTFWEQVLWQCTLEQV